MEQKLYFQNSKGDKLCGILADPTGSTQTPIVILCHGFTTNKNRPKYMTLSDELSKNSIASFRFDLFGHGESEGDFADITISEGVDDALNAIEFVKNQGYKKIIFLGCSFGGIVAFVTATKSTDLQALALISPVSDYPEVEKMRRSDADIADWKKNGFIYHTNSKGVKFRLNYSFWEDIQKYLVYKIADQINISTVIVHGDADDIVPITQSRKTAKLIPDCQLVEIEGADHRYKNPEHFEKMIKTVVNFIVQKAN